MSIKFREREVSLTERGWVWPVAYTVTGGMSVLVRPVDGEMFMLPVELITDEAEFIPVLLDPDADSDAKMRESLSALREEDRSVPFQVVLVSPFDVLTSLDDEGADFSDLLVRMLAIRERSVRDGHDAARMTRIRDAKAGVEMAHWESLRMVWECRLMGIPDSEIPRSSHRLGGSGVVCGVRNYREELANV